MHGAQAEGSEAVAGLSSDIAEEHFAQFPTTRRNSCHSFLWLLEFGRATADGAAETSFRSG